MTHAEFERLVATCRLPTGSQVRVSGMSGVFTIENQDDRAVIALRSEHGAQLRVGRLTLQTVKDLGHE